MILLCVIVWVVVDQGFICVSSVDREMSLICEECQVNVGGGVEGDFPEPRSHRVFLIHSTDTSDNRRTCRTTLFTAVFSHHRLLP